MYTKGNKGKNFYSSRVDTFQRAIIPFRLFHIADHEARGHHSTVGSPTNNEIERAIAIVPEFNQANSFVAVQHSSNRYIIHHPRY